MITKDSSWITMILGTPLNSFKGEYLLETAPAFLGWLGSWFSGLVELLSHGVLYLVPLGWRELVLRNLKELELFVDALFVAHLRIGEHLEWGYRWVLLWICWLDAVALNLDAYITGPHIWSLHVSIVKWRSPDGSTGSFLLFARPPRLKLAGTYLWLNLFVRQLRSTVATTSPLLRRLLYLQHHLLLLD